MNNNQKQALSGVKTALVSQTDVKNSFFEAVRNVPQAKTGIILFVDDESCANLVNREYDGVSSPIEMLDNDIDIATLTQESITLQLCTTSNRAYVHLFVLFDDQTVRVLPLDNEVVGTFHDRNAICSFLLGAVESQYTY